MDDLQSRRDLADALGEVVAGRAAADAAARSVPPTTRAPHRLWLLLVAAWGAVALAWIAKPAAIFGPDPARERTPSELDALARNALYLQRARIEQFRADSGRLPGTLREAGDVEDGVTYVVTAPDFVVVTRAGLREPLQLTNRMNADSFLGDALSRLPRPLAQ